MSILHIGPANVALRHPLNHSDKGLQRTVSRINSDSANRAPMFDLFLAQTQTASPAGPGGMGTFFVPMILIFVMMYFVMIRPQKKRQEQQKQMMSALKTGDRVVTNAGIHGLISNVKDGTVIVKVADNVKIEMEKSAITTVLKTE